MKEQGRGNSALCFSKIQKNFGKSLKNPLTTTTNYGTINTKRGEGKPHKPERKMIMKKTTMNTILSLIANIDTTEAQEVREELTAELNRGKEKADANRALYDEIRDAVVAALRSATAPVTAQELADETGYARGKIVYGLTNYWGELVVKNPGKVNTYSLREDA